jgi:hypothetical protein
VQREDVVEVEQPIPDAGETGTPAALDDDGGVERIR